MKANGVDEMRKRVGRRRLGSEASCVREVQARQVRSREGTAAFDRGFKAVFEGEELAQDDTRKRGDGGGSRWAAGDGEVGRKFLGVKWELLLGGVLTCLLKVWGDA